MVVYNVTIEIPDKDYFEVLLIFLKIKSIMSIQHSLFTNIIYSQATVWFCQLVTVYLSQFCQL